MKFKVNKLQISTDKKDLVDISFEINESFALVGQSGSGKSLTLKAFLDMLPLNLTKTMEIESDFGLKRGVDVSIVPQNPFTALSPLSRIDKQFILKRDESIKYMKMVNLDSDFLHRYPSELSGGQLQRVIIAMALSQRPKLLLLDEPTTALDSDTKSIILDLIKELQIKVGYKILFVTHDTESAKELCQDIAILKDGIIVERGAIREVLKNPQNSYSKELIQSNFKNRKKRS